MIRFDFYRDKLTTLSNSYIHGELAHGIYVDEKGNMYWYRDGELHRDDDKPAAIYANGYKAWYKNNKLHRDNDKPAAIHSDGTKEWWVNGKRHRDNDQPAVIYASGARSWYKHGEYYYPIKRTKNVENGDSNNDVDNFCTQ